MHGHLYCIKEEESRELRCESASESSETASLEVLHTYEKTHLLSIIADEDTVVGFLLGGIGDLDEDDNPNYFIVTRRTTDEDIERAFYEFSNRKDIGIILIQKEASARIHNGKDLHKKRFPVVIQIPGKNGPYEICLDHIFEIADAHEKEKEGILQEKRDSSERKASMASSERRSSQQSRVSDTNGDYAENFFK
ncbi:unnamed protein product [Phaedon cochleariae]|uniref:V-type proton ATPase subunit F n=1 Tax=Phaedon cochleariae TaxID=80249 RepID=A0A9N9X785_PHACE|nr:unnamed protein product [Phaedon cochleariae]